MSIKIAFAGKGGVGKSTLASLFIKALSKDVEEVLAVDCDPVTNLGRFLGIENSDKIVPIVQMKDLINERMEVSQDKSLYKLNPLVNDIPDKFASKKDNIKLIVMGTVKSGGSGCMCPESGFLKALLSNLLLNKDQCLVMDMEAGVEHLGRATAGFVDHLFIVIEPSLSSIEAAKKISNLASDLKIKDISVILNKVRSERELKFTRKKISPLTVIGNIPFNESLLEFSMKETSDIDLIKTDVYESISKIKDQILEKAGKR